MSTKKGSSIWLYFANTEDPEKARCKICKKSLKNKRLFNLKQHLSHNHNIQVRLSRKRDFQPNELERIKPGWIDEKPSTTTIFENMSSPGVIIKNEVLLDNLLEISDKNAIVNGMTETHAQCNVDEEEIDINSTEDRVISTHDDLPVEVSNNDEEIIDPLSKTKENGWVMLEESTISTNIDYEPLPKSKTKSTMPKGIIISEDNFDDPTARMKEESFEKMFKKRKLSLQLECLEMHNYKIKLEIWEMEQKLQIQSSKFTKNITARRKRIENNDQ